LYWEYGELPPVLFNDPNFYIDWGSGVVCVLTPDPPPPPAPDPPPPVFYTQVVAGCTTPGMTNYDPTATQDNGSCYLAGCTTPGMTNYNPAATVDDGSCQPPPSLTCGQTRGDLRLDDLLAEYQSPRPLSPMPSCWDFALVDPNALVTSTYFRWGEFDHPEDNPFQWAIVGNQMLAGLDRTQDYYSLVSPDVNKKLKIDSGYRSPHVNAIVSTRAPYTSPHMWGHAADFKPEKYAGQNVPPDTWDLLVQAAKDAGGGNIEPYSWAPNHVHAEW
jgi:hypothetical protein